MSSTVLVTGVSRYVGARFARETANLEGVDRVIGIDTLEPRHPIGAAEFVRADLRNPLIGRILEQAGVTTVVHLSVSDEHSGSGSARVSQKEHNVIGTMHLLAAAQAQRSVRRIVLKSTSAVYGSSPRDPVRFAESAATAGGARAGWVRDAVEVEGFVRTLTRRRPDVTTCVLRLAHIVGSGVHGTVTEYLRPRVVPVPLGFDARLQLLHEDDAIGALGRATTASTAGIVNVAGDGVVPLSRAVRLTRGIAVPVPVRAGRVVGGLARRTQISDLSDDQIDYLVWGRVLDTTRMRDDLDFHPAWTTRAALLDFAESLGPSIAGAVGSAVRDLVDAATAPPARAEADAPARPTPTADAHVPTDVGAPPAAPSAPLPEAGPLVRCAGVDPERSPT